MQKHHIYINSVNYFRGISILFIVAGHCFSLVSWHINTYLEKVFVNLIFGGSVLFVFISGFLFHHIFYKDFSYRIFMINKVKNVLTPYLILSFAPIIYFVFFKGTGPGSASNYIFSIKEGFYYQYVRPILMYLWSGRTMEAYWYIPFVMIVFLLSPLFIAYIQMRPVNSLLLLFIMLVLAALIHRPIGNLYPLQSVIYFAPVYAFGILFSIYKDEIYRYLKGKEIYLVILILSLASLQVVLFDHYGNYHKSPFVMSEPDLIILQKMIMCIFFMVFLHRFEDKKLIILDWLASASFAIFFLHPFVIYVFFRIINNMNNIKNLPESVLWLFIFPVVVLSSMAIAKAIKAIFRSHSRQVIGW